MAKDSKDTATRNLLRSPGAKRQAEHEARKKAAGFKRTTVYIHLGDYDAGKLAAELGSTNASDCPPGHDRLSWMLGYCEHLEKAAAAHAAHLARQGAGQ